MTIENDFLPFAVGAGSNVLSQSDYAALAAISTGYQSGIAQSAAFNKTWRQSSIMAAVLAQFIVAETGQPAIDDGTTATLLANFQTAVAAAAQSQVILADTGAANAYAAANPAPLTALPTASGLVQRVSILNANTGASTYAPDGLAAKPVYGLGLSALQGGELIVKGIATLMYVVASTVNGGNGAWVLLECTGGALQIPPATASQHAPQVGQVQRSAFNYAGLAGGTANALTATLNIAPSSYTDYLLVTVRIASTNTGSVSLNVNGLGVVPVISLGHNALQGGELVAGGFATFAYSSNFSEAILLSCTGGGLPIGAATQSEHAMQLGQVGHGQCRLSVTNTTTLTLAPYNGNNLVINGVPRQIPSAGVTLSNAGLSASTLYYIYASWSGSAITLAASATGHSTASTGIETKTGDTTQTLVGMIYTNASSQFVDSSASRTCLNWFNRRKILGSNGGTPFYSFSNTSAAEINTSLRVGFLCWSDEQPLVDISGTLSNSSTSNSAFIEASIDTVGNAYTPTQQVAIQSGNALPFCGSGGSGGLSEGYHFSMCVASVGSATAMSLQTIQTVVCVMG